MYYIYYTLSIVFYIFFYLCVCYILYRSIYYVYVCIYSYVICVCVYNVHVLLYTTISIICDIHSYSYNIYMCYAYVQVSKASSPSSYSTPPTCLSSYKQHSYPTYTSYPNYYITVTVVTY